MYNKSMKQKIIFAILLFMGILVCPDLVLAKYDYYVDIDADDDGDGSKDKPFKKIKDALDEGGEEILIEEGTYKENITLNDDVKLKGSGDDTIIKGSVHMKDGSVIEKLKVEYGGVFIGSGDSARIEDVSIVGAGIGIKTEGNGKLKVLNSEISKNGKGMYIQKDKDVEIVSSIVSNNDEEGVDIRQNVDGIISGNKIRSNGESGIEVIAGGSELKISGNTLQSNKASGIAIQYYKIADKKGALRVFDNIITTNKDYGINCKNPSGGSPGKSYWTESVSMGSNKMLSNKSGDFAAFCKFSDDIINIATKTEEELEQERLAKEKEEEETKEQEEEKRKKLEEIEEGERLKLEEEVRLKGKRLQQEREQEMTQNNNIQQEIKVVYSEFLIKNEKDNSLKKEVENRSNIIIFIIGSDYNKLDILAEDVLTYDDEIVKMDSLKNQINDQKIKNQIEEKMNDIREKEKSLKGFIINEVNKFSLLGWFFDLFKRP